MVTTADLLTPERKKETKTTQSNNGSAKPGHPNQAQAGPLPAHGLVGRGGILFTRLDGTGIISPPKKMEGKGVYHPIHFWPNIHPFSAHSTRHMHPGPVPTHHHTWWRSIGTLAAGRLRRRKKEGWEKATTHANRAPPRPASRFPYLRRPLPAALGRFIVRVRGGVLKVAATKSTPDPVCLCDK